MMNINNNVIEAESSAILHSMTEEAFPVDIKK
jgi:hypothetical protein